MIPIHFSRECHVILIHLSRARKGAILYFASVVPDAFNVLPARAALPILDHRPSLTALFELSRPSSVPLIAVEPCTTTLFFLTFWCVPLSIPYSGCLRLRHH